jgi:hypothetical protein
MNEDLDTFALFLRSRDPDRVAAESFSGKAHREMLAQHEIQRARCLSGVHENASAFDGVLGPERLAAAYEEQKFWRVRNMPDEPRTPSGDTYKRNPDRFKALVERVNNETRRAS